MQVTYAEKSQMKVNSLKKTKTCKTFKGTVLNRALPSLRGVSLKITISVPLKGRIHEFSLTLLQYHTLIT